MKFIQEQRNMEGTNVKESISNRWLIVIGALGIFTLAACSTGLTSEESGNGLGAGSGEVQTEGSQVVQSETDRFRLGDSELPALMQLILGVLQLESTDLAIDADQADEMLPLWKAYRSISGSDTVAQAELEALVEQIQEVMTADQLTAISSMKLTPEDMQSMIEELGIELGLPEGLEEGNFQFPPGGLGGPGGPGGGFEGQGRPGGGVGEGNFDPEAAATARAEAGVDGEGRGGLGSRAGIFLLDPLIELLEQKAGQEGA